MAPDSPVLKMFRDRLLVWLPLVGASIPPLLIVATVVRYGLNVPYYDQWGLVDFLDKVHAGQYGFADLWVQANEHRIILPGLVMLALARATGWDIRYELAANVLVALGVLGMLTLLIHRTTRQVAPRLTSWLVLTASLTTFSLTQWGNWLWGWQLQIFMNALTAVVTIWALARWGAQWRGLVFGLLAAIAGVFSFATGLMLLALVPLGLLMAPRFDQGAGHLKRVALAMGCGAGVVTLYLNGFRLTQGHPTPLFLFSHPLSYAHYILIYLGGPLGSWSNTVSAVWGAVGIVTFAWCSAWLWTRSPAHRHALLPWILLGLYGILSGLMTGIGRAGFGVGQALSSRYITISSLFWVSCAVIGALGVAHLLHDAAVSRGRALTVGAVTTSLLALAGLSYGASWIHAKQDVKDYNSRIRRGGECLMYYNSAPDECLQLLYPHVPSLRKRAHLLESLSLGPFARSRLERPLSWANGPGSSR